MLLRNALRVVGCLTIFVILSCCSGGTPSRVPPHVEILMNARYAAPDLAWRREIELYEYAAAKVVKSGRHVVVVPITDNARHVLPVLDETPPLPSLLGEPNEVDATVALDETKQRMLAAETPLEAVVPNHNRTEIIAAVQSAAERFGTDPSGTRKLLIILTTGYEQSGFTDMANSRQKLTRDTIAGIIGHLRETNALPQLPAVDVCMAGMTAGLGGKLDTLQQNWVRDFWMTFFEESQAHIVSYNVTLDGCKAIDDMR